LNRVRRTKARSLNLDFVKIASIAPREPNGGAGIELNEPMVARVHNEIKG
jgi:hypothetical protein